MNDSRNGFFFELTPDRVLEAVETSGLLCTGRCFTLNSYENRVYDVELEKDEQAEIQHSAQNRRVVKFYRPGRWSLEQILEEHEFLKNLTDAEVPAIAPLSFPDGKTLHSTRESGIWYALFPKVGGRAPDELSSEQLVRIGRLLARIHNVGASKKSNHRIRLDAATYGYANLEFLLKGNWLPLEIQNRYKKAVEKISEISARLLSEFEFIRIHGDCHLGNLLWNDQGPFFLDFDDMVCGPAVQDIWLLVPGRDPEALQQREILLQGYEELRKFDRSSLKSIELLRALRFVHYASWIARRWEDPSFPHAFPQFNTHQYWTTEVEDLETQVRLVTDLA